MCVTIPATAVRLVLALLVCCVAVECQDGELKVRAVSLTKTSVRNSTPEDLTNLILKSDIALVTWNFFPGNDTLHSIQNRVNTITGARYSLIYSLERHQCDTVQYAFYYKHALFRNVAFQGYGYGEPFSIWFPFVVIFSVFQPRSKPLTLAALHVQFRNFGNTPSYGKRTLAKAVREISANGNPFALIGKFPVDALNDLPQDLGRIYLPPNKPQQKYVGPAFFSNGLNPTVSNPTRQRFGMIGRGIKPLSINIKMSQLVAEPDVRRPHIHRSDRSKSRIQLSDIRYPGNSNSPYPSRDQRSSTSRVPLPQYPTRYPQNVGIHEGTPEEYHHGFSGRTPEMGMNPAQDEQSGLDLLWEAIEINKRREQAGDRDHRQPHADHSRHIHDHQH